MSSSNSPELVHAPISEPIPSQRRMEKKTAFYPTFICLCICVFIATLDTVIVAASLPAIASSLKATSNAAYWCGSGFLFAQTVAQPIYGGFGDTLGHKSCMMAALGMFTTASLFCATAQNIEWLVAARVVSLFFSLVALMGS
jgi:MFS family permease